MRKNKWWCVKCKEWHEKGKICFSAAVRGSPYSDYEGWLKHKRPLPMVEMMEDE